MFNNILFSINLLLLFYAALIQNALPSIMTMATAITVTPSLPSSTKETYHYHQNQMSDDCRADDGDATFLVCQLRTLDSSSGDTGASYIENNFNFTRLPTSMRHLRLECIDDNFVEMTLLNAGGFRQWTMLNTLEILYCKIGNLTHNAFTSMQRLRNLTIRTYNTDWSSMGLELGINVFDTNALADLQQLDLSENNMWLLPAGVFCALHNLQHLNLTRNRLHDLLSLRMSKSQKCLQNLVTLELAANNIENVPQFIFSGLKRLRHLNLQQNRIHSIADAAFIGLHALNVIRLDENNLHSLSPELFNETKQLREIHVKNNSLNVLAPELFSGLVHLTVLDLSHNQLTSEWINSLTLKGLTRLTVLDLSHNHLRQIQDRTFDGLWQLGSLTLANNRLFSVDPDLFVGLRNLKVLSIDFNRLTKLPAKLFQHTRTLEELHLNGNKLSTFAELGILTELESLDLGENLIKTLDPIILANFTNLLGLRLTENYIEYIKAGVFDKMIALQILNLSRNKISLIEPGAFDKNTNLHAIRLDGNYLKDLSGLFVHLPTLVWLNVSENRIESFEYTMIPTQLQWLDIHANRIERLGNYFEIKQPLALTVLDASANRLNEITGNSIPNSMEMLYLNHNRIARVQAYTFFKKPNISRVDLVGNRISALDTNALRISTVPKGRPLPEFYIGANPYLCDCNLDWLQRVTTETRTQPKLMDLNNVYCKLIYNRGKSNVLLIDTLPNQFLCEYHSQCSSLCHCCDFSACDCKMDCPERCTCFHDQSWTSNVIDCSRADYANKFPPQIPMEATQIYLDGNDFENLSPFALIGRRRLRVLYLNASNIVNIQNRTFFGLKELELLNIADNRLRTLNGYEFDGLVKLRELFIQNNRIERIDSATFRQLQLKILRLENNRLKTLNAVDFPHTLIDLRISQNLWQCDCQHFDQFKAFIVREAVKDRYRIKCYSATVAAIEGTISNAINIGNGTVMPIRIEPYDDGILVMNANASFVCSTMGDKKYAQNNNGNGNDLTDTDGNEHSSSSTSNNFQKPTISIVYQHLPLLVTTLLGIFILILLTLIVFIFRQELRVWFHSRFGIRLFYSNTTAIDRHERDKLFDAFVSYSSKDEAFVIEHLAPVLENGVPPYKLCLHYRDFPVGAYIADTIVHAIDSSRRTIMILSKNFIKSEWCRFEFKSAHHQVLRDRRRRLIVILLGDVPQKDLIDPDIRLYLKTNTYISWGDKLFWQRLRFALPDAEITQCPNNIAMELTTNSVAAAASAHRIHNNVSGSIGNSTKGQRRNQNIYETHDMSTLSAHNTTNSTIITNSR